MRARDVMVRAVATTKPETTVEEVARLMINLRISGVPVLDRNGQLVGIITEGDLLRRAETGTERRRSRWSEWFSNARLAAEYVKSHARRVEDVMTREVVSVGNWPALARSPNSWKRDESSGSRWCTTARLSASSAAPTCSRYWPAAESRHPRTSGTARSASSCWPSCASRSGRILLKLASSSRTGSCISGNRPIGRGKKSVARSRREHSRRPRHRGSRDLGAALLHTALPVGLSAARETFRPGTSRSQIEGGFPRHRFASICRANSTRRSGLSSSEVLLAFLATRRRVFAAL